MYRFGQFSDKSMSFIITDPATPRPFDNFLWNDAVFSCVHQTGQGYCDIQIDGQESIKLYTGIGRICDLEVSGRDHLMSRIIYVRDNDTGEFWTVGWDPVCHEYETYRCEQGLGFTKITSITEGIEAKLCVFVPTGKNPVELWQLSFKNGSGRPRDLSVFAYNQYTLMFKWGFESYGDMLYRGVTWQEDLNALIIEKHPFVRPHNYLTGFMAANRPVAGYDGSMRCFLGPYGSQARPIAVVEGQCTNKEGSAESTIGVLQFNLQLDVNETTDVEIVNGLTDSSEGVAQLSKQYFGNMNAALSEVIEDREALQAVNNVTTPDEHFNRMFNGWLKQQCQFGATWCRWGWMGYRDIVQHGGGVAAFDAPRTRSILIEALKHQYANGLALRGWNPVDTKSYSDSALWLIFTLCWYLKECGDFGLLEERIPYYDKGEASVLEHILTALNFLENNKGAHELLLIKFGDWNDSLTGIGKEGRGESIWLSMAYTNALRQTAELLGFLGQGQRENELTARADNMSRALHDKAWDGDWFRRCYDDNGRPIGSAENEQGRIYLNTQSWALIAGIADDKQKDKLLAACDEQLLLSIGYRLMAPPYLERDDHIGRISYMEPGIAENGTIYSHGNAFMILAALLAGEPDRAYDTWKRIHPAYVSGDNDPKQNCPPYIMCNGYFAPEHRNNPLQMEYTWMTGSVAWFYHALMDHMIGVRADYDSLIIDPCLPTEWPEVRINRNFRGKTFNVHILCTGTPSIRFNDTALSTNRIPLKEALETNTVEVTL